MGDFGRAFKLKIEQQKEEIERLRSDNNMQQSILDSFAGIYWWKDKEGIYRHCNAELANALGLASLYDIIGKTDYELPWHKEADVLVENDNEVMRSGKVITQEEPVRGKDGVLRIFLVTKAPLKNIHGGIIGTIGSSVDISQQKKFEAELKSTVEKLELANKVKSEFIANMSHDLRTPMTGIMGMFLESKNLAEEIIKKPSQAECLAHELIKYIEVGEGSSNELLDLFNEILETINLQSGTVSTTSENFNVEKLIQKNLNLLQSTASHENLTLSIKVSGNVPENLYGLRRSLDRILMNLISNAIKFTEKGSVNISASMLSAPNAKVGEKIQLQICVEDTGIGIPEDKFEEIFGHFSKLISSYRGVYKGYGLGLYAVQQYVEKMSGTIKVESIEGEGSRFILNLPFFISDYSDQEESFVVVKKKPKVLPLNVGGKPGRSVASVLVTEDSAAAALAIVSTLKRLECLVDHVTMGKEAISMARDKVYDLIFMDVGLPDMSGLEVTKKIRKFSDVPVIALTGHVDKEGVCLEAGMQELLEKPAGPDALESILHKYVLSKVEKVVADTAQAIIDWGCCVEMLDGSESIAKEILHMCGRDLKESMRIINRAYSVGDVPRLLSELHKVRGGVCYLKLPQLERALKDFHLTAREQPQDRNELDKHHLILKQAVINFQTTLAKDFSD